MINNTARIVEELQATYIKKNHDYGNSFDQSLDEDGLIAAKVRIGDKVRRINQLMSGEKQMVDDESVVDTLLDLANYCIMTHRWSSGCDIDEIYNDLKTISRMALDDINFRLQKEGVEFIPSSLAKSYKELGMYIAEGNDGFIHSTLSWLILSSIGFVNYLTSNSND